jgi:3-methyladenine DNA glycosylase AlkC
MAEGFQLREVFNQEGVLHLANSIKKTWSQFSKDQFIQFILPKLDDLSFGDRNQLIKDGLKEFLPKDIPTAIKILLDSLDEEIDLNNYNGMDGFITLPQCAFVREMGIDRFDLSMNAFYEMTKRFSAEFDIRAFITKYPEKAISLLHEWTQDQNYHVRRLVSEGTRPRLPLGSRLPQFQKDPTLVLELLEKLKDDSELYVRRSVANNLNDISKDNPDIVVKTLQRWSENQSKEMQWVIRHALRTILKQGHQGALELLGYPYDAKLEVQNLVLSEEVTIGSHLEFSFKITSTAETDQELMIDYIVHYMKANGKTAPKVFKLSKKTVKAGETLSFSKKHSVKQMSTRKHYAGEHALEMQVNGKTYGKHCFFCFE